MYRVKAGLSDLFRGELNPILEEMMPRTDEYGEWAGFEGTCEDSQVKYARSHGVPQIQFEMGFECV
jgi:hypothetical protein